MLNISDGIEAAEAKGASDLAAANNLLPINWAVPFKPKQEARIVYNAAALNYAMRTSLTHSDMLIPNDDEVLYGRVEGMGKYLVHVIEIIDADY